MAGLLKNLNRGLYRRGAPMHGSSRDSVGHPIREVRPGEPPGISSQGSPRDAGSCDLR